MKFQQIHQHNSTRQPIAGGGLVLAHVLQAVHGKPPPTCLKNYRFKSLAAA